MSNCSKRFGHGLSLVLSFEKRLRHGIEQKHAQLKRPVACLSFTWLTFFLVYMVQFFQKKTNLHNKSSC